MADRRPPQSNFVIGGVPQVHDDSLELALTIILPRSAINFIIRGRIVYNTLPVEVPRAED
jgi:hypothetical protein